MMNVLIVPDSVGAHDCQPGKQLHRTMPNNWAALLLIRQTLDHYGIQSKLGEGGVAYKGSRYALGSQRSDQDIVTTYDIRSDAGTDFIVMEYIEGQTLKESIPPKGMSWLQP